MSRRICHDLIIASVILAIITVILLDVNAGKDTTMVVFLKEPIITESGKSISTIKISNHRIYDDVVKIWLEGEKEGDAFWWVPMNNIKAIIPSRHLNSEEVNINTLQPK